MCFYSMFRTSVSYIFIIFIIFSFPLYKPLIKYTNYELRSSGDCLQVISTRLQRCCFSNYQFSSPTTLCLQLSVLVSDHSVSPVISSGLRPLCVSSYQFSYPTTLCLQLSVLVSDHSVSPVIISRLRPLCVSNY